jgi:hypothetical protein
LFVTADDATPCDEPKSGVSVSNPCIKGPRATGVPRDGPRKVLIAQLTLDASIGSQHIQFDAQGKSTKTYTESLGGSAGALVNWEENCIELWVGGAKSGEGTHVFQNANCKEKCKKSAGEPDNCQKPWGI